MSGRQFAFFTDPNPSLVDQVAATGLGGVAMGPYFIQKSSVDSSLGALNLGAPAPYLDAMRQANRLGMRVTLKPIIDASVFPNHPAAGATRAFLDPGDPAAWFADYWNRALQPYLEWSDIVVITTETTTASSKYPAMWRDLVSKIRTAGFRGPIVTDGESSDLTVTTTPWYDTVTWLGASFYPTIDVSSDASAVRDWQVVAQRMADAHTRTGLPIYMSEVGVFGLSETDQIRWIDAMAQVLGPLPWWRGFVYWRWTQDPVRPMSASIQAALKQVATRWAS